MTGITENHGPLAPASSDVFLPVRSRHPHTFGKPDVWARRQDSVSMETSQEEVVIDLKSQVPTPVLAEPPRVEVSINYTLTLIWSYKTKW